MGIKTFHVESKGWTVKFHASTGRTYQLNMMGIVRTTNGLTEHPMYPVALVEDKNGNIKAIYPNPMFRDIFVGLEQMAYHYDSAIESYHSIEDMVA